VPHDIKVIEWGSNRSRIEQRFEHRLNPRIATELSLEDGINSVRAILPLCYFDAEGCAEGISMLKSYRKQWDDIRGVWKNEPRHDMASHGSDAFQYLACAYRDYVPPKPVDPDRHKPRWCGDGRFTVNDLLKIHDGGDQTRIKV
jgi:hypothetical protein